MNLARYRSDAAHFPLGCRLDFAKREFYTRALGGALVRGLDVPLIGQNAGGKSYYTAKMQLNRAVAGEPYVNHSGLYTPVGLNLEVARTNICLQSQDLTSASWSKTNVTPHGDVTTAPDGTATADDFIETSATGEHKVDQVLTVTAGSVSVSFFAKANGRNRIIFRESTATGFAASFELLGAGTVLYTPNGVSTITALLNGWYHCKTRYTQISTGGRRHNFYALEDTGSTPAHISYAGDTGKGLYLWGVQVEDAAGFPFSYIPTTTTSVARAADTCSLPSGFLSGIKDRGYIDIDYTPNAATSTAERTFLDNRTGASGNLIKFFINTTGSLRLNIGSGNITSSIQTWSPTTTERLRMEWSSGVYTLKRNNAVIAAPVSLGVFEVGTIMTLGNLQGVNQCDGSIKSVASGPL